MSTKTWNADTGSWFDASNWTPESVPETGDSVIIGSGQPTIGAGSIITGESIVLGGSENASTVTLTAIDATFRPTQQFAFDMTLAVTGNPSADAHNAFLVSQGNTIFDGRIDVNANRGSLTIKSEKQGTTDANFTLPNTSKILVTHESALTLTGERITNDGTIEVNGRTDVAAGLTVTGPGRFDVDDGGILSVAGTIDSGQTVYLLDGSGELLINNAEQYLGWIGLKDAGALIDLTKLQIQSVASDSAAQRLTLYSGPNQTGEILKVLKVYGQNTNVSTSDFQLSSDGSGGTLVTYAPWVQLYQPMPVPVVAKAGTLVSLSNIMLQSFGTPSPNFFGITLQPTGPADETGDDVGYWEPGAGAVTPVWYVNGAPITESYRVQAGDDVKLLVGNSIKPVSVQAQLTPEATGSSAVFSSYDIYMVDPAVAARVAGTPTAAKVTASAQSYFANYPVVPNTSYCYIITNNVAAAAGAPIAIGWDNRIDQKRNSDGGFWRIVYDGTKQPAPVANWSTLVKPGDVVSITYSSSGIGHVFPVLKVIGEGDDAEITVYDNVYRPAGATSNHIGIGNHAYWKSAKPDQVLIYRLDPEQQYLIGGSIQGEAIQGSIYNNLINPGGGADTIIAGLGNNEIQDATEALNGITVTDFHLGDRLHFTDLGLPGTTASYAGGKLHVFSNGNQVAAITMPTPQPGENIAIATDGEDGTLIGLSVAQALNRTQFEATLGPNFDAAATAQIVGYLQGVGVYTSSLATAAVQQSAMPPVDPFADVAELSAASIAPITTATDLKAIIAMTLNSNVVLTGSRNVLLASGNGNDLLTLRDIGDDSIMSGGGNDTITTGQGRDTVEAGDGNDVVWVGQNGIAGSTEVFGGAGDDTIGDISSGQTPRPNISSDPTLFPEGNNQFDGGDGNDSLYACGSGNDTLTGGAGNDMLLGSGSGKYLLDGGTGNDVLNASGSSDETLTGDAGNDTMVSFSSGIVTMDGTDGDDSLQANGTGAETLTGGTGNDTLQELGGAGTHSLEGDDGNDVLNYGGTGANNDALTGGLGNDTLVSFGTGAVAMDGDDGEDSLQANGPGAETLAGGNGDDTLQELASAGAHSLDGGNGNDVVNYSGTGTNNDVLTGGLGNDTLVSFGTGIVSMDGGEGDDSLQANGIGAETLTGGNGNDTLQDLSGAGAHVLDGGNGNDVLNYSGSGTSNDVVTGGLGNDTLVSFGTGIGLLTLDGGEGDDSLQANGTGAETLAGGNGNDTLLALTGAGPADSLDGGAGDDIVNYSGSANNDTLAGGDGNDTLTLFGSGGKILANGGNDDDGIFFGLTTGSDDTIDGGAGSDTVNFLTRLTSDIQSESTDAAGVTTIVFKASGGGQTVFVQNIETLQFQNGDQLHAPFPNVPPPLA